MKQKITITKIKLIINEKEQENDITNLLRDTYKNNRNKSKNNITKNPSLIEV